MLSPSQLMKRVGVGGGLVPFIKCVGVYFIAASDAAPSAAAVAAKCAPVLCLLVFALLQPAHDPPQAAYARRIAAGLALSALGDALLVWPGGFEAGMGAFAAAHVAYLAAFGFRPRRPQLAAACYVATAVYLPFIDPPGVLKWLVPLYALVLASMAWRGLARGGRGAAGALLFLASDALLAFDMFGQPVPHKQVLVMSTYYLGQLGIALSVRDRPAAVAAAGGPEPVAATTGGPEPVAATTEGPEPVAATTEGPEPVAATTEGSEPVAATTGGPEPVAATTKGPEPVAATTEGPEPVVATTAEGPEVASLAQ